MVKNSNEAINAKINVDDLSIFDSRNVDERIQIQYLLTLGGDGTILYAAKQFPGSYIPPIIAFSMVRFYDIHNFRDH